MPGSPVPDTTGAPSADAAFGSHFATAVVVISAALLFAV
jgi:hypothetical protein